MEVSSGIIDCRANGAGGDGRKWFAVFTVPRNERATVRQLNLHEIESFLPTYETVHVWKNRQRKKVMQPLFPTYLFVHISCCERVRVLETPGVLQIVGTRQQPTPMDDSEIAYLRTSCAMRRIEPFRELVVGEPVRVRSGPLEGLRGVLVRRKNDLRFVLTLKMINQHAAIEVDAHRLEPA